MRKDEPRDVDVDGFPKGWWDQHLQAWDQQGFDSKVAEKVSRVRTIRGLLLAIDIMSGAFQDVEIEATIAEWLGIDIVLDAAYKDLSEERNVLTSWLNRGRGELKAEAH